MRLADITSPRDLRSLTPPELVRLSKEIRVFLIDSVSRTGGHLGPNLGVVELTLALHRVFDSPSDRVLWDTGHQSYVHKMLTGRQDFSGLRKEGGLSGYPSRAESVHDLIENSHASTALSYADGLAKAHRLRGESERCVVAVIGDGALTGGMAWEALNNIAASANPVVIVLNDNGHSYAPTVGGIADHMAELAATGTDERPKGNLFENLGLSYLGPVDGHDIAALEAAFGAAREAKRPVVVHCRTRKGNGYPLAEQDTRDHLHAVGSFDPVTGQSAAQPAATWTQVFGDELVRLGTERPDVVALTAAMLHPVGLAPFAKAFPDRVFDVGIAEQHAVASAAGLAAGDLHPVVAVYATFLNRAMDQVLMDVALHGAGVTFVLDRAGITGDDGPSHNGMWDLSLLQAVPGLRLAAPRDAAQVRAQLREALDVRDAPTVVRFPKGAVGPDIPALARFRTLDVLARTMPHRERCDLLLVSVGAMARVCTTVAERLAALGFAVTVVDPRWVKPVDEALCELAADHEVVAVVEDNLRVGGVGSALSQALREAGLANPCLAYGLPLAFPRHCARDRLLEEMGLGVTALEQQLRDVLTSHLPLSRRMTMT
ncbi:1-deoxy-D-xylulose-5-phosphate synthase [Streptomyces sp. MMG1533]|nr:1-deoxy-D-xylulose-5-phosphate synthase [Streptomyces sp. MMG1533]KOU57374.1 1-deoxy-D-xylulose-5-phosphate synthase [Streptomyces sp. MMG1533]